MIFYDRYDYNPRVEKYLRQREVVMCILQSTRNIYLIGYLF